MNKVLIFAAMAVLAVASIALPPLGAPQPVAIGVGVCLASVILAVPHLQLGVRINEVIFGFMANRGLVLGMTTLAVNKPRAYELGDIQEYPVIAADIIYEGAAVGENGSGYARPLQAGDPFLGFAERIVDNSAGAAGDKRVRVKRKGQVQLAVSGASAITANDGPLVYASDDDTFTLTATSNSPIGRISRWIESGVAVVDFDASLAAEVVARVAGDA